MFYNIIHTTTPRAPPYTNYNIIYIYTPNTKHANIYPIPVTMSTLCSEWMSRAQSIAEMANNSSDARNCYTIQRLTGALVQAIQQSPAQLVQTQESHSLSNHPSEQPLLSK